MATTFHQIKYGDHLIEVIPVWKHTPFSWDDKAEFRMKFIVDDYGSLTRRLLPVPTRDKTKQEYRGCYYVWYSEINDIVGTIYFKQDGCHLNLKKGTNNCNSFIQGKAEIKDAAIALVDAWHTWDV